MANDMKMYKDVIRESRRVRIHPVWYSFILFCESLNYGEIEKLKIQDGLPVSAEAVRKKIKFTQ